MKTSQISLLIKPASSLCNLRCKYCFYHDVAEHRQTPSYGIMSAETVTALLDRVWEYVSDTAQIHFAFQGGEPTLAGLSFYEDFVSQVLLRKTPAQSVSYSIQTNGILLDDDWCEFLHRNAFLVGLSLDCTEELHDLHRVDGKGMGTYSRVLQGAKRMSAHEVEYNVLAVVTKAMARKPEKLWNACVRQRFRYLQFIPCLSPFDTTGEEPYGLTPELYAGFLIAAFRGWKRQLEVGNYISVRLFDNLVMVLKGYPADQCGLLGRCSQQWVVEADGSVYPCDFYVLDGCRCGNVLTDSFEEMGRHPNAVSFLEQGAPGAPETSLATGASTASGVPTGREMPPVRDARHPMCASCRVWKLCGGGCKRYRDFYHRKEGYCPYQDFLYTILGELLEVAQRLH